MEQHYQSNKKELKESATNNKLQSAFMPIFQSAENEIKRLIVLAFWLGLAKYSLRLKIIAVVKAVEKKLPKELLNKDAYINGMLRKSDLLIRDFYDKPQVNFRKTQEIVKKNIKPEEIKKELKIDNPKQLVDFINDNANKKSMWAEQKAAVRVQDYPKRISQMMSQLAEEPMTTSEEGKKPISLWQKAELDIRHSEQMKKLQEQIESGVVYAWLSSHPDCSKRCEKWQGKLVRLTEHATMSGFRVKKMDGIWVYSLPDIMDQKDKYGYNNNIISGFNCRHYTIPYEKGVKPVEKYTADEVKREREINNKIRAMEREIRTLKSRLNNLKALNDPKYKVEIQKLNVIIKKKVADYKEFCEKNGYAWQPYRIK